MSRYLKLDCLSIGDTVIVYEMGRWDVCAIQAHSPSFVTTSTGRRFYVDKVRAIAPDRDAAFAMVKILAAEQEQHYRNRDAETRRHEAAVNDALQGARQLRTFR